LARRQGYLPAFVPMCAARNVSISASKRMRVALLDSQ
jgi:hypothetical protein